MDWKIQACFKKIQRKGDPGCQMTNRLRITIDTLAEIKREYNDVPVCMGECPYVCIYICMYV